MMASLFSGVSGLRNHQTKLNVIGNNIANVNTIGFKPSSVSFQEALVQTYKGAGRPSSVSGGTNPVQMGLGMEVAAIDTNWQQGGLETTGAVTDLAIQGNGFFILGDFLDNAYYTRAGSFGFDADSNLVDPATGLYVMGKMANSSGTIPSLATISPITLPFGQQDPPSATTSIELANNLDASKTAGVDTAHLSASGLSGVILVQGEASDGVGGTHTITITGAQAQNATFSSASGGAYTNGTTLSSLGVTDISDFTLDVDATTVVPVQLGVALAENPTIQDLVNAVNQLQGISCSLSAGEVVIERDYAGDPGSYSFESSVGVAGNIITQVFGIAAGSTFTSAGGAATTYVASDSFVPDKGTGPAAGPVVTSPELVYDAATGLVMGLSSVGGGGIEVASGATGLTTTDDGSGTHVPLVIDTDATIHNMSINVFDTQGTKHGLSLEFFKSIVPNRWEWTAQGIGTEQITDGGSGYVQFNDDGSLAVFDYNGGASGITMDPRNGAANLTIVIDAGTSGNFDGITGFSSGNHTASIINQDGYGLGILEKISVDKAGYISGIFSNGITRVLAQIILADFSNQGGLRKVGKSLWQPTGNSGEAREGVAGETIGGQMFSGALESSSVDIAQEFTNMITAQRGFQANSRVITTSDQMLDELVNLRR